MAKTVVGIFDSVALAEKAAKQIKDNGLRTNNISIVARHEREFEVYETENFTNYTPTDNTNNDNDYGATVMGSTLGVFAFWGMGPSLDVATSGPIPWLLHDTSNESIVGKLVDLGIPEEAGQRYEQEIQHGKILWIMTTSDEYVEDLSNILKRVDTGNVNIEVH